jgi:hypothetical protein
VKKIQEKKKEKEKEERERVDEIQKYELLSFLILYFPEVLLSLSSLSLSRFASLSLSFLFSL